MKIDANVKPTGDNSDRRHGGSNVSSNISFNGTNYIPRVNMPMRANSYTLQYGKSSEVLGVDPQYTYQLDFAKTKLYQSNVSKAAYGYLHQVSSADDANDNTDYVTDATREKDGPYVNGYQYMYVPSQTYDMYSVSGQGLGGMFRPYRNDIGVINEETQKTTNENLGLKVEYGTHPAVWRVGIDANYGTSTSKSNNWIEDNEFLKNNKYDQNTTKLNEPVYFKYTGESAPVTLRNNFIKYPEPQKVAINRNKKGLVYSSKALNYLKNEDGVNVSPVASTGEREIRNTLVKYIEYKDVFTEGIEPKRKTYYKNSSDVDVQEFVENINPTIRKPHHIAEIINTNTDGTKYVYGIAAYNTKQEEHTFNASDHNLASSTDPAKVRTPNDISNGYIKYAAANDSKSNTSGNDHYYNKTTTPGYAHSYLLTEVLSPDYVDLKGDGITDDDAGTAVKLNYTCATQNYKWRVPYDNFTANYNEGLRINGNDDMGSYTYGEKEEWYLKSIVSKGQIAIFKISKREDGCGVADNNGGIGNTANNKVYQLNEIALYNKYEYEEGLNTTTMISTAIPIKVVHFDYDYSLCKNINNNTGTGDKGKLTLKKIWFTYGNSEKGALTPYKFEYSSGTTNPSYNFKSYDRWGNYQPNNTSLPNSEWSYTNQDKTIADDNAKAWNLETIFLPSGGKIKVQYEADDYAYVQDRQAMEMFKIEGVGKDANFVNHNKLFDDESFKDFKNNLFVYFKFKTEGSTVIDNLDYYKNSIDNLFFNIYTDFPDKSGVTSNEQKDYVRGYINNDNIASSGKCL